MRLPDSAHSSQHWRIHELAPDFQLEDVWALPTPGGADDFPRLVSLLGSFDPSHGSSAIVRALFTIRWTLGGWLGWDKRDSAESSPQPTLLARLPADLRGSAGDTGSKTLPFTTLYMTDNEWAAEIMNRTVDGILHLGWVQEPGQPGRYRGQMAVLVKRNGRLGSAYMAAITPFRHLIVYPRMMRDIGRGWPLAAGEGAPARA